MPQREDVHYFGAGPAPLPTPVLEEAAKALLNYNDMGIGIAEMSHRSPDANKVLADAKTALATLLDIPTDDYEILFLQSGGSGEFSAVVYNMVGIWVERMREFVDKKHASASEEERFQRLKSAVEKYLRLDYLVTGSWSLKASQEAARLMGKEYVHVVCDSREQDNGKFRSIPDEKTWKLDRPTSEDFGDLPMPSAFTYLCDNETVDGVEFPSFPAALESKVHDRLVVADMSSNFISRKIDVRKYAVIFGGAQKNIGTTGITIVIVRKNLLPPHANMASSVLMRKLGLSVGPIVLDWATIAKNNSLYNTLPIFDVWIAGQVMQRLVSLYGSIAGQEKVSDEKAELLYGVLDRYPEIYQVVPSKSARSRMNICLRIKQSDEAAEKKFLGEATKLGLLGLKGHRSVGGIRISNCKRYTHFAVRIVDHVRESYPWRVALTWMIGR